MHEILYKEEEGNWTFSLLKASAVAFGLGFIHLSNKGAIVDGVGSAKANKQILSDYSRMEIQDGRVLPRGYLAGSYIPLMKDGEAISLRLTDVGNGELLRFRFQK